MMMRIYSDGFLFPEDFPEEATGGTGGAMNKLDGERSNRSSAALVRPQSRLLLLSYRVAGAFKGVAGA